MLALQETEDEEKILEAVQEGIEAFQEEQKDVHVRDRKMVEKVDELERQNQKAQRRDGQKDYPGRTCPLYGQERGGNPLCFKACGARK